MNRAWVTVLFSLCGLCWAVGARAQSPLPSYVVRLVQDSDDMPEKKLRNWGGIKKSYPDSMLVVQALANLALELQMRGFAAANIDSAVWKGDTCTAFVHKGRQLVFKDLNAGNVPEEVLRKSGFRTRNFVGRPFQGGRLVAVKRRLVGYYEDRGHPFAEVRLADMTIHNDSISASLFLDRHQEFRIDSIVVKGKSKIKENYLRNYLGIRRNERYNETKVNEVSTRLREIPFVNETEKPQVMFHDDKATIYVFLDRKRASQFDGILGILPDNANPGEVLITGEIKLKLLSALNRGELIDIQWRKMQARTQNLNIHLTYPFLFNTPFGLDGTFELYKRDSLFLNLKGIIGVQYHLVGNDHIKVFADLRSTDVLARSTLTSAQTVNPDNVDSRTQLYGFGYRMQRLDYRLNPRRGIDLYAEASVGTKRIVFDSDIGAERYAGLQENSLQVHATLTANYFIPIPNRSTVMLGVKGGLMRNPNLFESEMFRIGGLKSLRGFDEESIYADLYAIGTIEFRFLLNMDSYIFAFADGAYYENRAVNRRTTDRPIGFGLGISFATKIGIFSLTYAMGKQFDNPIDARAGKIHFGIVSFF
ncbi:MAG: BamA/TamA family outer membrane protein [Flavobacteriales bacterium]|nr:BamA/TamA family outer membrane protein [Flavobacteriales bacterium]